MIFVRVKVNQQAGQGCALLLRGEASQEREASTINSNLIQRSNLPCMVAHAVLSLPPSLAKEQGNAPHILATMHNLVIALIHRSGSSQGAAPSQHFAACAGHAWRENEVKGPDRQERFLFFHGVLRERQSKIGKSSYFDGKSIP